MSVERIRNYLKEKEIDFEFYEFSESTLTVKDSAEQLDIDPKRIVKSLVFKDEDGSPILVVVSGNKRVDEDRLSEIHGSSVSMAKPKEVERYTGYRVGGVPPVSHGLKTFVDLDVVDYETVIAGGGSSGALVKIDPRDIIRVTSAELVDVGEVQD